MGVALRALNMRMSVGSHPGKEHDRRGGNMNLLSVYTYLSLSCAQPSLVDLMGSVMKAQNGGGRVCATGCSPLFTDLARPPSTPPHTCPL